MGRLLISKNITVSCAESCTGGLFAGTLTDIPGISCVFDRRIVTYSNKAKMEELGVKEETLETFGARKQSDRSRDGPRTGGKDGVRSVHFCHGNCRTGRRKPPEACGNSLCGNTMEREH